MGNLAQPKSKLVKAVNILLCIVFFTSTFSSYFYTQAPSVYAAGVSYLPLPNEFINISNKFNPVNLRGIRLNLDNPFQFNFIIEQGDSQLSDNEFKLEGEKLIKYFLAALTTPDKDLWVNLSPYEQDKIVPNALGLTEMGKDLLGQDYILKQLIASLTYPENPTGKQFWQKIYERAGQIFGTTNIPLDTFTKVWIVPDKAVVYEENNTVIVGENHLKVMLEEDYFAMQNSQKLESKGRKLSEKEKKEVNTFSSQIMRQVVIPVIEEEVNSGKNFTYLRQIYHSLILAIWFKKKLKQSIENTNIDVSNNLPQAANVFNNLYINKNKIKGVDSDDPQVKEKIYSQYIEAYKTGLYDYVRKDTDSLLNKPINRRYYSGGFDATKFAASSPIVIAGLEKAPINGSQAEFVANLTSSSVASLPSAQAASSRKGLLSQATDFRNETIETNLAIADKILEGYETQEFIAALRSKIQNIIVNSNNWQDTSNYYNEQHINEILNRSNAILQKMAVILDNSRHGDRLLRLAIYLKDIGYFISGKENYENASKEITRQLLGELELSNSDINSVCYLIDCTKFEIGEMFRTRVERDNRAYALLQKIRNGEKIWNIASHDIERIKSMILEAKKHKDIDAEIYERYYSQEKSAPGWYLDSLSKNLDAYYIEYVKNALSNKSKIMQYGEYIKKTINEGKAEILSINNDVKFLINYLQHNFGIIYDSPEKVSVRDASKIMDIILSGKIIAVSDGYEKAKINAQKIINQRSRGGKAVLESNSAKLINLFIQNAIDSRLKWLIGLSSQGVVSIPFNGIALRSFMPQDSVILKMAASKNVITPEYIKEKIASGEQFNMYFACWHNLNRSATMYVVARYLKFLYHDRFFHSLYNVNIDSFGMDVEERYSANLLPKIKEMLNNKTFEGFYADFKPKKVGVVSTYDFSEIGVDVKAIFNNLIKNGFINSEGMIQREFKQIKKQSMWLDPKGLTYNNTQQQQIYNILQQRLEMLANADVIVISDNRVREAIEKEFPEYTYKLINFTELKKDLYIQYGTDYPDRIGDTSQYEDNYNEIFGVLENLFSPQGSLPAFTELCRSEMTGEVNRFSTNSLYKINPQLINDLLPRLNLTVDTARIPWKFKGDVGLRYMTALKIPNIFQKMNEAEYNQIWISKNPKKIGKYLVYEVVDKANGQLLFESDAIFNEWAVLGGFNRGNNNSQLNPQADSLGYSVIKPGEWTESTIKEGLNKPIGRGNGWVRITTAKEAIDFYLKHKGTGSGSNYSNVVINNINYSFKEGALAKMSAWADSLKENLERLGYFIIRKYEDRHEVLDFIPLGSITCDPLLPNYSNFDGAKNERIKQMVFNFSDAGALIPLSGKEYADEGLRFRSIQNEYGDFNTLTFIPCRIHSQDSAYQEGPSPFDISTSGTIQVVYCSGSKKAFIYDKYAVAKTPIANDAVKEIPLRQIDNADLGAQFSGDMKFIEELLYRAKMFYGFKQGKDKGETATPRQLVEYFLQNIKPVTDEEGLRGANIEELNSNTDSRIQQVLTELGDKKPKDNVKVLVLTLPYDKHSERFLGKVVYPQGGIGGINFKDSNGVWTTIILKEDLQNPEKIRSILTHELREIALRQLGYSAEAAHDKVSDEENQPNNKINRDTESYTQYQKNWSDKIKNNDDEVGARLKRSKIYDTEQADDALFDKQVISYITRKYNIPNLIMESLENLLKILVSNNLVDSSNIAGVRDKIEVFITYFVKREEGYLPEHVSASFNGLAKICANKNIITKDNIAEIMHSLADMANIVLNNDVEHRVSPGQILTILDSVAEISANRSIVTKDNVINVIDHIKMLVQINTSFDNIDPTFSGSSEYAIASLEGLIKICSNKRIVNKDNIETVIDSLAFLTSTIAQRRGSSEFILESLNKLVMLCVDTPIITSHNISEVITKLCQVLGILLYKNINFSLNDFIVSLEEINRLIIQVSNNNPSLDVQLFQGFDDYDLFYTYFADLLIFLANDKDKIKLATDLANKHSVIGKLKLTSFKNSFVNSVNFISLVQMLCAYDNVQFISELSTIENKYFASLLKKRCSYWQAREDKYIQDIISAIKDKQILLSEEEIKVLNEYTEEFYHFDLSVYTRFKKIHDEFKRQQDLIFNKIVSMDPSRQEDALTSIIYSGYASVKLTKAIISLMQDSPSQTIRNQAFRALAKIAISQPTNVDIILALTKNLDYSQVDMSALNLIKKAILNFIAPQNVLNELINKFKASRGINAKINICYLLGMVLEEVNLDPGKELNFLKNVFIGNYKSKKLRGASLWAIGRNSLAALSLAPSLLRVFLNNKEDPDARAAVATVLASMRRYIDSSYLEQLSDIEKTILYRIEEVSKGVFPLEYLQLIYSNNTFSQVTADLGLANKYSLALAIHLTLKRNKISLTENSIEKMTIFLRKAHDRRGKQIVVDRDSTLFISCHEEDMFDPEEISDIFYDYLGINKYSTKKEKNKKIKSFKGPSEKGRILWNIRNSPPKAVWYCNHHGGMDFLALGGETNINAEEFMKAWIARAKKYNGRLSDVIIFIDACYSGNFATNVINLFTQALERGDIKDVPWIVASSNRETISWNPTFLSSLAAAYAGKDKFYFSYVYDAEENAIADQDFAIFLPLILYDVSKGKYDNALFEEFKRIVKQLSKGQQDVQQPLISDYFSLNSGIKKRYDGNISLAEIQANEYRGIESKAYYDLDPQAPVLDAIGKQSRPNVATAVEEGDSSISVDIHKYDIVQGKQGDKIETVKLEKTDINAIEAIEAGFSNIQLDSIYREQLLALARLHNNSPPPVYAIDKLVLDAFGFPLENENLISLWQSILSDKFPPTLRAIALWHELGHKAITRKLASLYINSSRDRVIAFKNSAGNLLFSIEITNPSAQTLISKAFTYQNNSSDFNHYLLRAAQRQMFGNYDLALSALIKIAQQVKGNEVILQEIYAILQNNSTVNSTNIAEMMNNLLGILKLLPLEEEITSSVTTITNLKAICNSPAVNQTNAVSIITKIKGLIPFISISYRNNNPIDGNLAKIVNSDKVNSNNIELLFNAIEQLATLIKPTMLAQIINTLNSKKVNPLNFNMLLEKLLSLAQGNPGDKIIAAINRYLKGFGTSGASIDAVGKFKEIEKINVRTIITYIKNEELEQNPEYRQYVEREQGAATERIENTGLAKIVRYQLEGIIENIDTHEQIDFSKINPSRAPPEDIQNKINAIRNLIENQFKADDPIRKLLEEIIRNFLKFSPKNIFLTDESAKGFFGLGRRGILFIDRNIFNNPIGFLHEIIEYIKYDIQPNVITELESLLNSDAQRWLGDKQRQYTALASDYFSENRAHYVIRAFTRQFFTDWDKTLTYEVKTSQDRPNISEHTVRIMSLDLNSSNQQLQLLAQNLHKRHNAQIDPILKNMPKRDDVNRRYVIDQIIEKIKQYKLFDDQIKNILEKIGGGDDLDVTDESVLRELKNKLKLRNSLVAMNNLQEGDLIVAVNMPNIKFLNSSITYAGTDLFIKIYQEYIKKELRAELIEEEDLISQGYKQSKFVIKQNIVSGNGGIDKIFIKLNLLIAKISKQLTDYLHDNYKNNKDINNFVVRVFFGISVVGARSSSDDDAPCILADMQALIAAKIARRNYETASIELGAIFDQRHFDALIKGANKLKANLSSNDMTAEKMIFVRGKSENELKIMGSAHYKHYWLKQYLDIIDLFDYPKTWPADVVTRRREKEAILNILAQLETVITSKAPPSRKKLIINQALAIIKANDKNPHITSDEAFNYYANQRANQQGGVVVAVDIKGFWAKIQNNLINAADKYLEVVDSTDELKQARLLNNSLTADDKVKKEIADTISTFSNVIGEALPMISVNGVNLRLINQKGGDEIIFFVSLDGWPGLASKISKIEGVRVTATVVKPQSTEINLEVATTEITHGPFGEAYTSAQDADKMAKELEEAGVSNFIISLEPVMDEFNWVVYYNGKESEPFKSFKEGIFSTKDDPFNILANTPKEVIARYRGSIEAKQNRAKKALVQYELLGNELLIGTEKKRLADYEVILKNIDGLSAQIKSNNIADFIEVIKKALSPQGLSKVQREAIHSTQEEFKNYPNIDFNPEEIIFMPTSSWLGGLFNFMNPKLNGKLFPISDGGKQYYIVLINTRLAKKANISKTLSHETIHKQFRKGALRFNLLHHDEYPLFHILEEALTESFAADINIKLLQNQLVIDIDVAPERRLLMAIFPEKQGEIGISGIKTYKSAISFLDSIVNVMGEGAKDKIFTCLAQGDFTVIKGYFKEFWDDIITIIKIAQFKPEYLVYHSGLAILTKILESGITKEKLIQGISLLRLINATYENDILKNELNLKTYLDMVKYEKSGIFYNLGVEILDDIIKINANNFTESALAIKNRILEDIRKKIAVAENDMKKRDMPDLPDSPDGEILKVPEGNNQNQIIQDLKTEFKKDVLNGNYQLDYGVSNQISRATTALGAITGNDSARAAQARQQLANYKNLQFKLVKGGVIKGPSYFILGLREANTIYLDSGLMDTLSDEEKAEYITHEIICQGGEDHQVVRRIQRIIFAENYRGALHEGGGLGQKLRDYVDRFLDKDYVKVMSLKIKDIKRMDDDGGSEIISERKRLNKIIDKPLLRACEILYDKNIATFMSSANENNIGVESSTDAYIDIYYDTLSEDNKRIVDNLDKIHKNIKIEFFPYTNSRNEKLKMLKINIMPINENTSAFEVNKKAMAIANSFRQQAVVYRYSLDDLRRIWRRKGEVEDYESNGYYYDQGTGTFYLSEEQYRKARVFNGRSENITELDTKGGIDLNPQQLKIEERKGGQAISSPVSNSVVENAVASKPFVIPFDVFNFQGFTFQIIKIERINDINKFLGISKKEEKKEQEVAFLH